MSPMSEKGAAGVFSDVVARHGRVDAVINNAACGLFGALEELDRTDLDHMFELNVFVPLKLMQLAAAQMRSQGSGIIVNVSSASAYLGGAGYGAYAASKAALTALSEALLEEVTPFGVKVMLVEPGRLNTDFVVNSSVHKSTNGSPYASHVGRSLRAIVNQRQVAAAKVDDVAREIVALIASDSVPFRYFVGGGVGDIIREKIASVERYLTASSHAE